MSVGTSGIYCTLQRHFKETETYVCVCTLRDELKDPEIISVCVAPLALLQIDLIFVQNFNWFPLIKPMVNGLLTRKEVSFFRCLFSTNNNKVTYLSHFPHVVKFERRHWKLDLDLVTCPDRYHLLRSAIFVWCFLAVCIS